MTTIFRQNKAQTIFELENTLFLAQQFKGGLCTSLAQCSAVYTMTMALLREISELGQTTAYNFKTSLPKKERSSQL